MDEPAGAAPDFDDYLVGEFWQGFIDRAPLHGPRMSTPGRVEPGVIRAGLRRSQVIHRRCAAR